MRVRTFAVVLAAVPASAAPAQPLAPASYAMRNGGTGTFTYTDRTYAGPGATGDPNAAYAPLAGGRGKLLDGSVGGDNILDPIVNNDTPAWVGWRINGVNPVAITFDFGGPASVASMAIHLANSSPFGDVSLPSAILWEASPDGSAFTTIGTLTPTPAQLASPASQWLTFTPAAPTAGRYVRATLGYGSQPWIFASEAAFTGVPTPAGAGLLAAAGLGAAARRRGRGAAAQGS